MVNPEPDVNAGYIGFEEALALVRSNMGPVGVERLPLAACPGYVSAEDVLSLVDSPQNDSSLRDGFAVRSEDVAGTSPEEPTELKLVGSVFAGGAFSQELLSGQTVKILSGGPLPRGADAVVSSEFCDELGSTVRFKASASKGRNVMCAGEDVRVGTALVKTGQLLSPARLAFAAVGGLARLGVYRKPRLAILSIGDELVQPGLKLGEGQVYASNSMNIGAWLSLLRIPFVTANVNDDAESIANELTALANNADAVITIGGAMHSERDLIAGVLEGLGSRTLFRHVRMGPGKGTSFRMWRDKPVFCLSGSPSSSIVGFVELALPGICNMAGLVNGRFFTATGRLAWDVSGRNDAWTEFKEARLVLGKDGVLSVVPFSEASRSRSLADADCLLGKPEGVQSLYHDQLVTVQLLSPLPFDYSSTERTADRSALSE